MKKVTRKKTGRPCTGSVVWKRGRWYGRITRPNGSRCAVPLDPNIPRDDIEGARAGARALSELARRIGGVPATVNETVKEYSVRWFKAREERGLTTVDDDRGRFNRWFLPRLGNHDVRTVERAHLEDHVGYLDNSVRADQLAAKSARNIWGLVSQMFRDACSAKRRDLRVREDNPAVNVKEPDKRMRKTKVFLYPSELLKLVACGKVPIGSRRTLAIITYLNLRSGEGHALTWEDVDLEHGFIHGHQSASRKTGVLKPTKTNVARRVPIEPVLLLLLIKMKEEAGGVGRVLSTRATDRKFARQIRRCLSLAGVTRAELFPSEATRRTCKAMTFHDLRATGITWRIVRGDNHMDVRDHAGHSTITTTEVYIRTATGLRGPAFGILFLALPASLLGPEPSDPPEPEEPPSPVLPPLREVITEEGNRVSVPGSGFGAAQFTKRLFFSSKMWRRRESNRPRSVSESRANARA